MENQKGRFRARRIRTADLLVPNQAEYLYPIARKNRSPTAPRAVPGGNRIAVRVNTPPRL